MFLVSATPAPVGSRDKCKDVSEEEDEKAIPSFLRRFAYSNSRSLTAGTSSCSTDASSLSSTTGPLGSFESSGLNEDEFPVLKEEKEEVFFDCRSHSSSSALWADHDGEIATCDHERKVSNRDDEIAIYDHDRNMVVYSDGSPAMCPPGTCVSKVPYDFLEFHGFNEAKATKMWKAMLKWREEREMWKVHRRPSVRFEIAKTYYPSVYHGFDKEDATVIEWSFPGRMVPSKLVPDSDALDEIMLHTQWQTEYLFDCLYTDEVSWKEVGRQTLTVVPNEVTTRGIVLIIDCKGAGIHLLTANVFAFIRRLIHQQTSYYPAMAKQVMLINSPFWVAGVFRTIKPLLPDDLPVEIVSEKNSLETIRKYVDDDQIPAEYGGSSPYALNEHPFELRLLDKAKQAAVFGAKDAAPEEDLDDTESVQSISSDDNDSCSNQSQSMPTTSQEPTFVMDCEEESLDLTPNPPSFDFGAMTTNIWNTISRGCGSCGGR